jgi:hypothetical protein
MRLYQGNGITAEFPLPEGADGTKVYLTAGGKTIRMKEDGSYRIDAGTVVFDIPPPDGTVISFQEDAPARVHGVCVVIYPDGTVKEVTEDPYILLVEAKAERDGAKKLLHRIEDQLEKSERLIKVEGDIAKDKLTLRMEKYQDYIEEAVKGAAEAAQNEVKAYIDQKLIEMRKKHKETMDARTDVEDKRSRMESRIGEAAEKVKAELAPLGENLSELLDVEARTKAASADVINLASSHVQAVIEDVRAVKSAAAADLQGFAERIKAENSVAVTEIKNMLSEMRVVSAQIKQIADRAAALDSGQQTREEGMKTLWNRMVTMHKRKTNGKTEEGGMVE